MNAWRWCSVFWSLSLCKWENLLVQLWGWCTVQLYGWCVLWDSREPLLSLRSKKGRLSASPSLKSGFGFYSSFWVFSVRFCTEGFWIFLRESVVVGSELLPVSGGQKWRLSLTLPTWLWVIYKERWLRSMAFFSIFLTFSVITACFHVNIRI